MSKIRHILSVIHYKTRGDVCFQLTHFPCDDWENIYTLSYYHHRIGSMNYYPLFRVRSWNNGVRCMSFCILMKRIWPRTDPCGAPHDKGTVLAFIPLINKDYCRWDKYDRSQLRAVWLRPMYICSIDSNISWSMVSNAALKSNKSKITHCFLQL